MSPAFDHQALPAELWLEIFAYLDDRSYSVSYAPFEFIPGIPAEDVNNAYAAVVLVCRNWHDWAISSLYRILKIPDSDSAWVAWVQNHPEYGQWVQRIVLRYTAAISRAQTAEFTGILRLCPNVIALIRPHSQRARALFEPAVPCPPLLSLKRLEWWNYSANSPMDGINSLLSAVAAAPNLEYLFIGLQSPHTMNFSPVPLPKIELPRLRTLRLGVANVHLRTIAEWTLPALDTLIMETPLVTVGLTALWASHGPQLRVVELGEHDGFLGDQYLTSCLRGCPALRELNYHLFSTALPPMHVATDTYPSVTTVGLHVAPAANLKLAEEQAHLKRHCAALGSIFPSLERLRIYGGLESLLGDKRFPSMLQRLIDRGCVVEVADEYGVVSVYRPGPA
ncbi:hypothetical protein C8R46DRAFT_420809 [Mycena filopes]|nr:hypothetical protein C8R46DRAFT_420809 [Mycena filopes]